LHCTGPQRLREGCVR